MGKNDFFDGYDDFIPLGSDDGRGAFFRVTQSAAPELYALASSFPKIFSGALKSLGWHIRGELKGALRRGGPRGINWQELSRMHIYRRMDLLKAGKLDESSGQYSHGKRFSLKKRIGHRRVRGKEDMMMRWKGSIGFLRRREAMGARLQNAIRYKMINSGRVDIGAVNPSAASFLEAVQAGKRGTRGRFEFTGTQPVTAKMRRAFFAAGVPLAKDTTVLGQPRRPLVYPVYQEVNPEIERYIASKITEVLDRRGLTWSAR